MPLILETGLRNVLANNITIEIDTGAGTSNMKLETSADAEVATIDFQNPSFSTASIGLITLLGVTLSDTSATGGTVSQFSLYDRDGTKQLEGNVLLSGGSLNMSSLFIGVGDTIDLTSFSIEVPA